MITNDVAVSEEAIFKVGKVISVDGRIVRVRVDKTKNTSHLLYRGELLKNISVGGYIKIAKGFTSIIGKVEGEFVAEDKQFGKQEYKSERNKISRTLTVSLLGFFKGLAFVRVTTYLADQRYASLKRRTGRFCRPVKFSLNCLVFEARGELLRIPSLSMSGFIWEVRENALPVCLLAENSNRLVSALEMFEFEAHHFVAISSTLGQAIMDIGSGRVPNDQSIRAVGESCALLLTHCEALDLKFSAAQIRRFRESIQPGINYPQIRAALIDVQQRVWDELESRKLFILSQEDARYFDGSQFPKNVLDRFPDVSFDAEEASKCLALARPTACVYHLMRVTECGLQQIGKKLGMKDDRPNWEPIIAKIDSELKKPYKERQYKGMSDFLANASAHLNAVKVAWRNRVMHVDRKHTPEEAREIYNATSGLMRYIAENLPEGKPGIVQSIRDIIKK